jgi:hypothetical protein
MKPREDGTNSGGYGVGGIATGGGGGAADGGMIYGGSSDEIRYAFQQGSERWLLWEILQELKAIRDQLGQR